MTEILKMFIPALLGSLLGALIALGYSEDKRRWEIQKRDERVAKSMKEAPIKQEKNSYTATGLPPHLNKETNK